MERKLKPLYFFGDFDPVNQGLLELARKEHERTGRPIVFAPLPAEKIDDTDASDEDRLAMLELALKNEPSFSIDSSYIRKDATDIYLEESLGCPANRRPFMSEEDFGERTEICLDPDVVRYKKCKPYESNCRGGRSFIAVDPVRDYIEEKRLYYVGKLAKFLKSEHRLEHSISVARLSYQIAISNKYAWPGDAYLAGLFHDIGKHYDKAKSLEIIKKRFPSFVNNPEWSYHQTVGAYLLTSEFHVFNMNVIDGFVAHATGEAKMSTIAKIVYAADKIDPLRGYDSSAMIKECMKNIDKGFLVVLRENRKYLTQKGYKVDNPMTKRCFDYYLGDKEK